jgi:hypothetical protein
LEVDANKITDKLTIKVASLNGKNTETEARAWNVSILTEENYQKLSSGSAGGQVIVVNGKRLEVVPAFAEFGAKNGQDARSGCDSLKLSSIGRGWRLPTLDEITAMYEELPRMGLGGFAAIRGKDILSGGVKIHETIYPDYWYSDGRNNRVFSFWYGEKISNSSNLGKGESVLVRAVREF